MSHGPTDCNCAEDFTCAEHRGYRLKDEPGFLDCQGNGGPDTCGGCDECLRKQAWHYANPDPFKGLVE